MHQFFAITCCPLTCSASIGGLNGSGPKLAEGYKGLYPDSLKPATKASLNVLLSGMKRLKLNPLQTEEMRDEGLPAIKLNPAQIREWTIHQVESTITLLKEAQNNIDNPPFAKCINDLLVFIETTWTQHNKATATINTNNAKVSRSPLPSAPPANAPAYSDYQSSQYGSLDDGSKYEAPRFS